MSLVKISEGPKWLAVGLAHADEQLEISDPGRMQSGLEGK